MLTILLWYYANMDKMRNDPVFIKDYAIVESQVAGLSLDDQQKVVYTIESESKFKPDNVNYNDMAQGCDSVGLVQIRNCDHPESVNSQARNPIFAVNFLIKNIDKCKTWWKGTCGRYKSSLRGVYSPTDGYKDLSMSS